MTQGAITLRVHSLQVELAEYLVPGADTLGNIPTASFGVTTGPNAVNPSGDAASGILRPEQARRFY